MRMHFSSVARVGWVGFLHVCKTLPVACMPYRAFDDEVDVYVHVLQISSLDSSATELHHRCVWAGLCCSKSNYAMGGVESAHALQPLVLMPYRAQN